MLLLTLFYLLVTIADWGLHVMGVKGVSNGSLGCVHNKFIVVLDNKGAWFLFIYNLLEFAYAGTMYYVFYYLPVSHGRVGNALTSVSLIGETTAQNETMEVGEITVETFMGAMNEQEEFHKDASVRGSVGGISANNPETGAVA